MVPESFSYAPAEPNDFPGSRSARDFTSMRATSARPGIENRPIRMSGSRRRNMRPPVNGFPLYILTFMASPRSAAAVILVRETPELEGVWGRRAGERAFQGGFFVFPGGQVGPDEDDKTCAARELFEEDGVRIDPNTLLYVGRWVTPAFAPRRFDTCFFLGRCPAREEARVMTGEHDLGEWIRPEDAV